MYMNTFRSVLNQCMCPPPLHRHVTLTNSVSLNVSATVSEDLITVIIIIDQWDLHIYKCFNSLVWFDSMKCFCRSQLEPDWFIIGQTFSVCVCLLCLSTGLWFREILVVQPASSVQVVMLCFFIPLNREARQRDHHHHHHCSGRSRCGQCCQWTHRVQEEERWETDTEALSNSFLVFWF